MNWSTQYNPSPLQQFSDAADSDDLDLTQMALLIALSEYPNLDLQLEQQSLDSLASGASHRLDDEKEPLARANMLSEYLFDEVGFSANQEDYYDPRNSYLNEVLERRVGIPITLSLLYIEVGKRLEMDLEGVGMPGHFLVRVKSGPEDILVDPFHRGIIVSEQECASRLQQIVGDTVAWDKRYVAGVSDRELITRILRNLRAIYAAVNDHGRVSRVEEWINALQVPPTGVTSP
tara:strand:+ start:397 stop:1095 length:699 start_codon:yes stop_codon:yes gene_type:complete